MKRKKNWSNSLIADLLSLFPAWLLILFLDPWTATVVGIATGFALIIASRTWWAQRPWSGRIIALIAMPFIALFIACFFAFGSTGPLLGMLLAASVLALAEGWNRRSGRSLVSGYPLATGALYLGLSVIFIALLLESNVTRYPTEDLIKALSEGPDAPKWSKKAKEEAVEAVRKAIERDATTPAKAMDLYDELAGKMTELKSAECPNGVYVTLYDKRGNRATGFAKQGRDTVQRTLWAGVGAVQKGPQRPRSTRVDKRRWRDKSSGTRIQIDVAGPGRKITYRPIFHIFGDRFRNADSSLKKVGSLGMLLNLAFEIEPGVDGMEIYKDGEENPAVMLPADPVTNGWLTPRVRAAPVKIRSMLRRTWRDRFGSEILLDSGDFTVKKFRTRSFGEPRAGAEIVDWYRGNVLLGGEISRETLVERIISASDWLVRHVKPDGRFHYEAFPPYKKETEDYNLPRHAGSIYGLFATLNAAPREKAFKDPGVRALEAGLRALDYVKANLGSPDPINAPGHLCFMDENKNSDSGSTALASIAISELPEPSQVDDPALKARIQAVPVEKWLTGMGDCMLKMIDSRGAVFRNYKEAQKMKRVKKEPLYFPGEVMLALVKAYNRLKQERFLEGARRIGDRQRRRYSVPLSLDWPSPGDHWIMQALPDLARVTGEREYAKLAVLMGRGYLREQYPPQEYIYPDYRGAYRRVVDVPRTTRAASRGEALGGAMDAARFLGEDASQFENAMLEGARHLIEQQFTVENSYFIPDDYDVIGAIRMGIVDNHVRVDNNQHGLVALIRALDAMDHLQTIGR
jgi:hypothetical protein